MRIDFQKLREVYKQSIEGDGIGNILLYRPIATVFTGGFIYIKFSANTVTFLSLISNITASYFFLCGDFFLAMICFHVGNILDCSDGQVAMYTNTKTLFGKYFDAWVDRVSYIIIFGSIISEYAFRTENYNFLYIYIFWVLIFFTNSYLSKISLEISGKKGLEVLQEKSQKFLGKFARYIRWDGTITAVIFHLCLYFNHLEFIIFPFVFIHSIYVLLGVKNILKKI